MKKQGANPVLYGKKKVSKLDIMNWMAVNVRNAQIADQYRNQIDDDDEWLTYLADNHYQDQASVDFSTGEIMDDPLAGLEGDTMETGYKFHNFKQQGDTFTGQIIRPLNASDDFEGILVKPYPFTNDGKTHILSNYSAILKAWETTKEDPNWNIEKTIFKFTYNETRDLKGGRSFKDFTVQRYKLK